MLDEKKIMEFITSEYSWEQIIYEVIAWEGLNPWDLDISKLSKAFVRYLQKMEELDFRIPAKYIMVAAVLLKMKSDYLRAFKEQVTGEMEQELQEELEALEEDEKPFEISPINIPPRREPLRKTTVSELVQALKKVLNSHKKKVNRKNRLRKDIDMKGDNINERIRDLYERINSILLRIRKREIEFSKLVGKWERKEIIGNFIPLVHLDQQRKVKARQSKVFKEIWVSKRDGK
ncbi:MAG: segregation/condensation protein A [Candidatus Aenigmarchaeota archaeon]|nr:segregation/condensation protein A [Candidatus Aenigmarchaeota archaeon]NIP41080.1 segregation/condensation protein A [Candidatus Aenigmarchaeota archaeon]NIQ17571.1 segregation/condensation protein A [Candidatus Aenigmarchaeota archaeon]